MQCGKNPVNLRVVRSDGKEWLLGAGTGWYILEDGIDDMNDVSYSVETSANVLTDGSSLVSKRVDEKDRTIAVQYNGSDKEGERGKAIAFLNPKFSFQVYVTYMGRTRWYEGELYKSNVQTGNVNKPLVAQFTILCLDPYFKDTDRNDRPFGDANPGIGWPFVSHVRENLPNGEKYPVGFVCSRLVYDGENYVNSVVNGGDVPVFYKVVIKASGTLQNPTIQKDGKFVKLIDTLRAGDELVFDFESAPPKVEKNGTNVIQSCSRDSSFTDMEMQVGTSKFSFVIDNTSNRPLASVQVLFYKKYLGV